MAPGALALVMMTAPQVPERSAVDRLDPHQRRDQHLVSARAQSGGGAFAIGLRAGDDQAHGIRPK